MTADQQLEVRSNTLRTCPKCGGDKKVAEKAGGARLKCQVCNGKGKVNENETR